MRSWRALSETKESSQQMNAKKKERDQIEHTRMTNVFEERNTNQSQALWEVKPKTLKNASDWYAWSLYWGVVLVHVEKLHALLIDLDKRLDEKGAVVSKSNFIGWELEYRERRQALLFCVDFMLGLANEDIFWGTNIPNSIQISQSILPIQSHFDCD